MHACELTCPVLFDGCGSHSPIKSEFKMLPVRMQDMGERGTAGLPNLAAHRKYFECHLKD